MPFCRFKNYGSTVPDPVFEDNKLLMRFSSNEKCNATHNYRSSINFICDKHTEVIDGCPHSIRIPNSNSKLYFSSHLAGRTTIFGRAVLRTSFCMGNNVGMQYEAIVSHHWSDYRICVRNSRGIFPISFTIDSNSVQFPSLDTIWAHMRANNMK